MTLTYDCFYKMINFIIHLRCPQINSFNPFNIQKINSSSNEYKKHNLILFNKYQQCLFLTILYTKIIAFTDICTIFNKTETERISWNNKEQLRYNYKNKR